MLKNIKIGKVLVVSFLILAVLVVIVGTAGLVELHSSNNNTKAIYNNGMVSVTQLTDVHQNLINVSSKGNAEIAVWVNETKAVLDAYDTSLMGEEEKAILATFKEDLKAYGTTVGECIEFVKKQDFAGALGKSTVLKTEHDAVEKDIQSLIKENKQTAASLLQATQDAYRGTLIVLIAIMAFAFAVAILFSILIPRTINRPIFEIVTATQKMAQGNLSIAVPYQSRNELGQLADGMMTTVRAMQLYIGNIADTLGKMAKGDLSGTVELEYIGDFAQIKESMVEITDSLNDILSQINQASNQVLSGAGQVSKAAQALSQGASQQASSIQELSASIQNISSEIKKNAQNAQSAKQISLNSTKIIENANTQMADMIAAMEHINDTSKRISKIIKTIDEIAFQTNILALNAAVEAARAGEAGKGFAVVADEVRNLASKSAEAAKDTTILIENTIQAVDRGSKIADGTAKSLKEIVDDSKRSAELIHMISQASALQAQAISQTTIGVTQISSVVQTNSATAQESAAASEELSGQADMLNQLVGKFVLR